MSKGKILLITTDFPPSVGGGIGTHSKFIAESLSNLDWEFVVLSEYYIDSTQEEIDKYSKEKGFPIYKLPPSPSFRLLIKKLWFCYKKYRKHKPDIILGTGRHPAWFAAVLSFVTRKPLVTIGHGTEFTEETSKNDFKNNRKAYGRSDLLISISHYTKGVVESCGIHPKKIEVIHNAADENMFKVLDPAKVEAFKAAKGIKDRKIIISVGSVSERKGQKVILRSLPMIKEKFPEVLYVVIGFPNEKMNLAQIATDLGVEDNLRLEGSVDNDDLLLWYNSCDIFSMTSTNNNGDYEGYGIAVIEAALCGKAAIVSDNAGLTEAVQKDVTGVIIPTGSSEDAANELIRLFSNPNDLDTLAKQAYKNSTENGTWEKKALEFDRVLQDVIKK